MEWLAYGSLPTRLHGAADPCVCAAKTPVRAVASYRVIVLGYSVGMVLSVLGHVPAALLFITTAGLAAGALFVSEVLFSARSTAR